MRDQRPLEAPEDLQAVCMEAAAAIGVAALVHLRSLKRNPNPMFRSQIALAMQAAPALELPVERPALKVAGHQAPPPALDLPAPQAVGLEEAALGVATLASNLNVGGARVAQIAQ